MTTSPSSPFLCTRPRLLSVWTVVCLIAVSSTAWAQAQSDEGPGYRMPPKAIADLIDAPPTPAVSVDPHKQWMLLMERPALPPISEVAQPELRLAGIRINPRTNGRSRASYYTRLVLKSMSDLSEKPIQRTPADARISSVRWSPDASKIAFTVTKSDGVELWVADVATASAKRLTEPRLNAAYGSSFSWMPSSDTIVCRMVDKSRGSPPTAPLVPPGPNVKSNRGQKAPARTYQDLLKTAHDGAIFEHYLTSTVTLVKLDGTVKPISMTGIVTRAEPSPDGKYLLVETVRRPFSYLVPIRRFARRVEVRDTQGVLVRMVADLPLAESVPIGFSSCTTGPRSIGWRADVPATVYWVEAQDGGDPKAEAEVRDKVYTLSAPFAGDPVALVSLGLRFGGITWGSDRLALVMEWWWGTRQTRTWRVNPSAPGSQPEILIDRTWEDRYADPGNPMTTKTPSGKSVLLTADGGNTIFLSGSGASPEGDRPFLDRFDLGSKETTRLWRSEAPYYERAIDFVDPSKGLVLTRRESKTKPPNYFLRDLNSSSLSPLTKFPHPTPQLASVYKEQIRYERGDGVKLTATIYLPPGKKPEDGPWPTLFWAYPQEFKSADAAGQTTDSPYRFVRTHTHSPLLWLLHGYAVVDDPSLPIVGEGEIEPNDTYVDQLVAGAKAAIDEAVRRGITDPNRTAIGGHSYGAFMTGNLLAHSDLFSAGIARSGAYNRTLTPFGFQSEERTLWEAPEVYFAMSPFMHAEKVNEPILLIHGEADNNSGTFPMQSERYYNALKGHGATARLVMLPHESHGYRSRESVMHMAWEMTSWLDKYVKNAKARDTKTETRP